MRLVELTGSDEEVIHEKSDRIYFEIIKGMDQEETKQFDKYGPIELSHYNRLQNPWLLEEKYYLGINKDHNPTDLELIVDMEKIHIRERFRVYYCLKFPHLVRRKQKVI